ncbi:hypothetical protein COCCU_12775 [Corynebacterium occultum]|uniref:Secreted protein n=1 Tax=Corynebacterium occultum TaxID=2675219 RepID=A0A6B8WAZ1_9CORY|nr:hypothetical protein [Corynebacterium occultum]QGU08455.1 hypothetical protein COCCU_12775 [Corynebacterium occultum]
MRKFLAGACAGIIGISALVTPAAAQDLPEPPMAEAPADLAHEEGQGSSLSSGSSADSDLLVGGIMVAGVLGAAAAGGAWAVQQGLIPNPLPGIIPGPAPAPQAPAPAPVVQPTPVLNNCGFGEKEVRPTYILLYCGDGHSALNDITWNSWSIDGASGRALLRELTCDPSCATGGATYRWVDFTLGGLVWKNGEPQFTRAYVVGGREYRID